MLLRPAAPVLRVASFSRLHVALPPLFRRQLSTAVETMDKLNTTSRLTELRALMKERNIHVYSEQCPGSNLPASPTNI